jgi:hypothetical protein
MTHFFGENLDFPFLPKSNAQTFRRRKAILNWLRVESSMDGRELNNSRSGAAK